MEQTKRKRPMMDERDKEIEKTSKSYALEFVVGVTQVLTLICLVKENAAWKGTLSLLFFGIAAQLYYKYDKYEEKPYVCVACLMGLIGMALLLWFCFSVR